MPSIPSRWRGSGSLTIDDIRRVEIRKFRGRQIFTDFAILLAVSISSRPSAGTPSSIGTLPRLQGRGALAISGILPFDRIQIIATG